VFISMRSIKTLHIAKPARTNTIQRSGTSDYVYTEIVSSFFQFLKLLSVKLLHTLIYWIKLTFAGWFILLMGLSNKVSGQCMSVPVKLEQRVEQSAAIIKAIVKDQEAYKDKFGNIYTLNTLQISAILKGEPTLSEIGAITVGGTIGNEMQVSYPAIQLLPEHEYLLFLEAENPEIANESVKLKNPELQQCLIYADAQGALLLQNGHYADILVKARYTEEELFSQISKITGNNIILNPVQSSSRLGIDLSNAAIAAITSISPDNTKAGTTDASDFITISGSGFGASRGTSTISFRNVNDGGATWITPIASDYVSWSDASITVKVPENAGTGTIDVAGTLSSSPVTIRFSLSAVNSNFSGFGSNMRQRYHLRNKNSSGGYTFSANTTSGFSGNTQAVTTLQDAMDTWTCNTGINWQMGATTTSTFALDNENVVLFDATLPAGVLGRLTNRLTAGSTGGCNGTNTVWWVNEFDLQMRPDPPVAGASWEYGPSLPTSTEYDFESVILHELGHAHGLGHRMASGHTMHYAIFNGSSARTLDSNEIRAGMDKIAYSTSATCFNPGGSGTPMTAQSCASVLPVELIYFNAVKENETVLLNWTTASEFNNDYFTIERSKNAIDFSPVGIVYGAGNSNRPLDYTFTDMEPFDGISYYRLKQTDFDTHSTYSRIVRIQFDRNNQFALSIYPNPASELITLALQDNSANSIISITEISGKKVYYEEIRSGNGNTLKTIDISQLAEGIYLLEYITDGKSTRSKFVKH
jgi:hypothetical protein